MKFTLEIDLDNEDMLTGDDVAQALREVAERCEDRDLTSPTNIGAEWRIRDINGNTVGSWEVTV